MSLQEEARRKAQEARKIILEGDQNTLVKPHFKQACKPNVPDRESYAQNRETLANGQVTQKKTRLNANGDDLFNYTEQSEIEPLNQKRIMHRKERDAETDIRKWLNPKRRKFITGVVEGSPVLLGQREVPSGLGRWMSSFFSGRPYSRYRMGVAFVLKRLEGGDEKHQVVIHGNVNAATLMPGTRVRLRGKVNNSGELFADEIFNEYTGVSLVKGRIKAIWVRLVSLAAGVSAVKIIGMLRNLFVNAADTFSHTAESSEMAAARLFSNLGELSSALISYLVVFGVILYGIFLMLGAGRR